MEDEDEPRTVVCMRINDASLESTVGGSKRETCSQCGAAVWTAPSTQKFMTNNPQVTFHIACTYCAIQFMEEELEKNPGEKLKIEAIPGQFEELAENIRRASKAKFN